LCRVLTPTEEGDITPDSVLQRASLLRALLTGIDALERITARAGRRSQLPVNVGRPWETHEEETLVAEFKAGIDLGAIAVAHGRTVRAIQLRLAALGMAPQPSDPLFQQQSDGKGS
jgi:hypothetical protein